jgi:glutamate--cysteine ligase
MRTGNRVGVELEWFTTPSHDPPDVPTLERLLAPTLPLPNASGISYEPGGQVELSTRPFESIDEACDAAAGDSDAVRAVLTAAGYGVFAAGFDPDRTQRLLTRVPRYVAMRKFFDAYGVAGGRMMCGSAAIHVNLDAGDDAEGERRWHAAHVIGPMLVAAFANSPLHERGLSGGKSARMTAWLALDPTRTASAAYVGAHPPSAWAEYALAAKVMFVRSEGIYVPLDDGLTFDGWIENGHALGYPTAGDLEYHLTTLFPPVRPHRHLELRMIDMLPAPWWRAAVALTSVLVCEQSARSVAESACGRTSDMWATAARRGLEDPSLHEAATRSFAAALDALERIGVRAATVECARAFVTRFTERGLSPADEQLATLGAAKEEAI